MGSSGLRQQLEARCYAHCYNDVGSIQGKLYQETLHDVFQGTTMAKHCSTKSCKDIPGTQSRGRSVVNFLFPAPLPGR